MSGYLAAAIQLNSDTNKSANIDTAVRLIECAARRGATLVALPELFNCLGEPAQIVSQAELIPGPTSQVMSQVAVEHQITLVAGSMAERVSHSNKVYNTSLLLGPAGEQLACYRKMHLFEVDLPGKVSFCEADFVLPGDTPCVTQTPLGRIGQATCYDLRFPELFRCVQERGVDLVVLPSAFTASTGPDHWEVLLRARAIENQMYVLAPNQFGRHTAQLHSYGRSMIVDPWGVVLATAGDGEAVITAEIDLAVVAEVRDRLPALRNRRL